MERCCHKENTVLGCRHQRSLVTSVSSPKTPLRHSDVDFHDVFGGPPRRLSNQVTRYSFGEGTEPSALRGGEDGVSVCNPWTGLSEKPVFGEEGGHDLDPFSSSPGSRVLSPAQPLPPPQAEIFGSSSNPAQLSTSLPSKVTRAMDFHSLREPGASNGSSYPYSPPSRFSNQTIQGDESPKLTTSNRADMGDNLENGSNSSKVEINTSQSHFSLYKWASKGVPFVTPLRRLNSSRTKVKSKTERCSSTNGRFQSERMVSELPEAIMHDVEYHYTDDTSASTKSFKIDREKQKNDSLFTKITQDRLEECQIVEEVVLAIPNLEPLNKTHNRIEDDAVLSNTRKEGKPYSLSETGLCGKAEKEISVLAHEVSNPELKSLRSLLHETDDGQDVVPENAKEQERKGIASDSALVDKASSQCSPRNSGDSLGRNGVKGKVREFVKKLNQEASSKPITNSEPSDPRSQSSRRKNAGSFRAEKGAHVSATETDEQMHMDNANRKKMVPDASIMVDENPKQQQRRYSGLKTAIHKSSGTTYVQKDSLASVSIPDDSVAALRDRQDSFQGNFVIEELSQEQSKQPQIDEDHDEIQVSDAKIRQWLSGKEGNIRSLLSTLQYVSVNGFSPFPFFPLKRTPSCQKISPNVSNAIIGRFYKVNLFPQILVGKYLLGFHVLQSANFSDIQVLWPESGWKPVPLVDIIEGNAVKRAYQKALLCLHPDKLQQKGAAVHQKYIAEKVFDSLQVAIFL
ncbi:J domain-containing protein required for chloroplast accumulation response 1 [Vitis vinifera]|uniref:J domain-containing protein required for chloroplast accumulation response 1 n=1 Tax=Vitis vinifera TaxID=29760 RepID=A0A438K1G9_VITVI|nr:J domain-containing protein required for chloroplast accumulation response 1 [Vitis vinifera]